MTRSARPQAAKAPILIGLGANLPSRLGPPEATLEAALDALARRGARILKRSCWYRSAPVPASDQPWFVNGVVEIAWDETPEALLAALHAIEAELGRVRRVLNEARIVDLDLLAFGDLVREAAPIVPHPRLHERAFVLAPLAEIQPAWRHPTLGATAAELLARLPPGQAIEPTGR
ncbi:MAG: 2-amino-4-hydroxy-6-hydroxymethyldihydropteridine diphosphokinase [Alphaproteobacteria bacterium]